MFSSTGGSMGTWSDRQLAAIGAVVATVLFVVAFALFGSSPAFDAASGKIVAYFHDHHRRLLSAAVLGEAGVAVMIGVVARLAVVLRDGGHRALAAVTGIAGADSTGMLAVIFGLFAGFAQLATFGPEAGAIAPLYRLTAFLQTGWFWVTLVLVACVAVLLLLGGISVKGEGVLEAGSGALAIVGSIAFLAWLLHLALLLWQPAEVTEAAPTPA